MNITARIQLAIDFATTAHEGQTRKYTSEPYIVHPVEVAEILFAYIPDASEDAIIGALLHDVVEDCGVTRDEVETLFGAEVRRIVNGLTDVSIEHKHLNRKARKAMDRDHIATQAYDVKSVKCADLISNTGTIVESDKDFAVTYMREKKLLLDGPLIGANPVVYAKAREIVDGYYKLNPEQT